MKVDMCFELDETVLLLGNHINIPFSLLNLILLPCLFRRLSAHTQVCPLGGGGGAAGLTACNVN